jgi:hypothetical protein
VTVGVTVGVVVGVGVAVGVSVGVFVGVTVGVVVDVGVLVGVLVGVSVGVIVGVIVDVGVLVGVFVGVFVGVSVGVFDAVNVCVAVNVGVKVAVLVGVGVGARIATVIVLLPETESSNSGAVCTMPEWSARAVAVRTPPVTLIGQPMDVNVWDVSDGDENPDATVMGLVRSGVPLAFGQKNVTLIVSASQASVVGGLLLTLDIVIVYVSVEPFTTKPVGFWTTMSFRAVSLQPAGVCEFGLLDRTWTTRREISRLPAAEGARKDSLCARTWSVRSTRKRSRPSATSAAPADFRRDDDRDVRGLAPGLKSASC